MTTRGGSSGGLPSTRELAGLVCSQIELDLTEFEAVEVPTRTEVIVVREGEDPAKTVRIPKRWLAALLEKCRS